MSNLILPGHIKVQSEADKKALEAEKELETVEEDVHQKLSEILPTPTGYKILVVVPKAEETYESGIAKAAITKHIEEVANIIAYVIKLGPDCYTDKTRFPSGPYCKEGDFIILRAYAGTRIKVKDVEYRLINDDSPEAVVLNPKFISKI